MIYDKGTNRQAFLKGQVDKYSWVDTGSSFGLSDILAGYLLGQLERREAILAKRRTVHDTYQRLLEPEADRLGIRLPVVPRDRTPAYHMYYVILPDAASRDRVLASMTQNGVQATFHYVPLHSSAGGQRFAASVTECPVSDDLSSRLLSGSRSTTRSTPARWNASSRPLSKRSIHDPGLTAAPATMSPVSRSHGSRGTDRRRDNGMAGSAEQISGGGANIRHEVHDREVRCELVVDL